MFSLPDFSLTEGFIVVNDEMGDMVRDWDLGKKEVRGAEDSAGRSIRGVLFAGEVSSVDVELMGV